MLKVENILTEVTLPRVNNPDFSQLCGSQFQVFMSESITEVTKENRGKRSVGAGRATLKREVARHKLI